MPRLCLSSTWTPAKTLPRWPITDQTWFWKYWRMHFGTIAKCCYWSLSGNTWWHSFIQDLVAQLLECKESNIRVENEMQMLRIWNNETIYWPETLLLILIMPEGFAKHALWNSFLLCCENKIAASCRLQHLIYFRFIRTNAFLLKAVIKLNMKRNYICFIPRSILLVQPKENYGKYQLFFFNLSFMLTTYIF